MAAHTPYVTLKLDGQALDIPQSEELPVAITYEIEAEDDFRQKKSGTSLDITVPATTENSKKVNTLFNPGAEDFKPNDGFNKPLDFVLIGAGHELMKGKAFVTSGSKQEGKPKDFEVNAFGDNADWAIPNKETTLQDVLSTSTHIFDKATIEASWLHDGTVENEDFVYAPNRNREPFGEPNSADTPDEIFRPINSRPALFLYWLLYRGFKKAGYKIQSQFFNTDYFRRVVLPWTWGNFFYITDKFLKEMGFLATGNVTVGVHGDGSTVGINLGSGGAAYSWVASNHSGTGSSTTNDVARYDAGNNTHNFKLDNVTTDIGYVGNALEYSYNPATGEATWTYLPAYGSLGTITVGFEVKLSGSVDCSFNSNGNINIDIFKNGSPFTSFPNVIAASAPTLGTDTAFGTVTKFFEVNNLNPGDTVTMQVSYHAFKSTFGFCFLKILCTGDNIFVHPFSMASPAEDVRSYFKLNYIRRQLGSVIEWQKFDKFKNFKWLDLLRGTIDAFNLQLNTDPTSKTVFLEPTHKYDLGASIGAGANPGYYNGNVVEWTQKEDISKKSNVVIFQDYEREVVMQLQDDANDGILKLMQDRHQTQLTQTKYVFPERFKKGSKKIENRFFSGVVHYEHPEFKAITGIAPQFICLIPENIANTSNPESEYTFAPKLAWYAGLRDRAVVGGWNWDGDTSQDLPYMFAVNYKPGGEADPVLTYCDQRISDGAGGYVKGFGLFKRFYWQRFAIMRHGKLYKSNFMLNNTDVINWLHREFKGIAGQRYQLIKIDAYKPLLPMSTQCNLWKFYPVTDKDADNTYPSDTAVLTGFPVVNTPDILYVPLLCIPSDIPT